jgi:enamine deaminase RidA (YjgF/YER057c/UK114 family)
MDQKSLLALAMLCAVFLPGCSGPESGRIAPAQEEPKAETPEYFLLRPEVERSYGYSHAVKIGDDIKISGAVSMDDEGHPIAIGDLEQQMKNAYSDLDQVLKHYGYTFSTT